MRTWLAPVALLLAVACGGPNDLAESARDQLEAATTAADEAKAAAKAASKRVAELETRLDELTSALDRADQNQARFGGRLATLRERIWDSVQSLRGGLGDARSASGVAAAEADDALARASEVARDLAVLEQRYDYHLRRQHGGG